MSSDMSRYALWAGIGLGILVEYPNLRIAYHTMGRDFSQLWLYAMVMKDLKLAQALNKTIPALFRETYLKHPKKTMLVYVDTGEQWTFEDVEHYSNQVGHMMHQRGFNRGDVVALYMSNKPKFVPILLGLAKVGITVALINSNLKEESLEHSINVANCRACIYEDELEPNVLKVANRLHTPEKVVKFQLFKVDCSQFAKKDNNGQSTAAAAYNLDQILQSQPTTPIPDQVREQLSHTDNFIYIYTSGTTGFPKPANGDHSRFFLQAQIAIRGIGINSEDRVYSALPLYHSSAMWMALGPTMLCGCTYLMRSKFSARKFWTDCVRFDATVAQYIGEMCRFLLGTPTCPEETQHKLRFLYGIGLSKSIWPEFISRFKIPQVIELYGSTEGNFGGMNLANKVGSVGFVPKAIPFLPYGLIRVDEETGNPIRDPKTGLCVPCQPGEPGEMVGSLRADDRGGPEKFQAYVNNKEETAKKLVRDVWKKGDVCFKSGDLLVMDEFGWLFFKDRTGDTFRWRGENVSTAEVEATISNIIGNRNTVVYGVEVPGAEGKAGMAAIYDPEDKVDLDALAREIGQKLPKYAQPLFLRMTKTLDLTGTYKLIKRNLQKEGFEVGKIADKVYFKGPNDKHYKLLDALNYHGLLKDINVSKL